MSQLASLGAALLVLAGVRARSRQRFALGGAIPSMGFVVDTSSEGVTQDVQHVVSMLVPDWPRGKNVKVTQMTGGQTNLLFKVTSPVQSVLVRVYGANTEAFIDRELECRVLGALSARGVGPTLFGTFDNGRIEGFFDSSRSLEFAELPQTSPVDFSKLIAVELARLHGLAAMPVPHQAQIWEVIDDWLPLAGQVNFVDDGARQAALLALDLPSFAKEVEWLKTQLPSPLNQHGRSLVPQHTGDRAAAFAMDIVFCHNDLNASNVLYLAKEQRCQFIDFEYGGYNYRAFDMANHLVGAFSWFLASSARDLTRTRAHAHRVCRV